LENIEKSECRLFDQVSQIRDAIRPQGADRRCENQLKGALKVHSPLELTASTPARLRRCSTIPGKSASQPVSVLANLLS
jgi:hypothetical protein